MSAGSQEHSFILSILNSRLSILIQRMIYNIQHYSIHDGPGIRTTVFFQGCPMRCWWCHNPESQDAIGQRLTAGGYNTAGEIIAEIDKDAIFYEESGGGVTFSGGEPLMQPGLLEELLDLCMERGYHTAIDTCGYADPATVRRILGKAGLFLYDMKLMDDARHLEYTGVSHELPLRNLELIAGAGIPVIVRFPVIPGITNGTENIRAIASLMESLGLVRIDLLPFHAFAKGKYEKFGMKYLLGDIGEPSSDEMESAAEIFRKRGFLVGIGG
jgi:pyruvate formate lyase activating enzyme